MMREANPRSQHSTEYVSSTLHNKKIICVTKRACLSDAVTGLALCDMLASRAKKEVDSDPESKAIFADFKRLQEWLVKLCNHVPANKHVRCGRHTKA